MNRRSFISAAGAAAATAALASRPFPARAAEARGPADPIQKALSERKGSLKGLPEPLSLPRRTTAGLEPYVPDAGNPWDRRKAVFLLRRTLFGARKKEIDDALALSPSEVVDLLLADSALPSAPGNWVNENYYYRPPNDDENYRRFAELQSWWVQQVVNQEFSVREKMVLFWHDHFATEYMDVRQPHFNYWLMDRFRTNPLGSFRQLVKDVTVSPCMLVYLNGNVNTKSRPNENFARELMELHTLGEGIGYTEDDIKASARALTGWTLKSLGKNANGSTEYHPKEAVFIPANHDNTDKTFMGQTGNWDAFGIIDLIFSQRQSEAAAFICRKLYREFVYEIADETIIGQLADLLVANDWELKPVLSTLLKSAHFFDVANIGAHITSPFEFYAGAVRTLEIVPATDAAYLDVYAVCSNQGLQLFQPPNVKGWPGYRTWISASRLASRWDSTDKLVDDSKKPAGSQKYPFDPVAFVTKISDPSDSRKITNDVIALLYDLTLNTYQTDVLYEKFMSGWRDYEWDINNPGAVDRIRGLFKAAFRNNEYQLI